MQHWPFFFCCRKRKRKTQFSPPPPPKKPDKVCIHTLAFCFKKKLWKKESILLDHRWWHKLPFKQISKSTMPIDSEHSYKYSWYCNLFCETSKHRTQMLKPRKRMGTWYRRYSSPFFPPLFFFLWLCCNVCIQDMYENWSAQPQRSWEYAHQHTYGQRQI